jgi:hypothetical protein
MGLDARESQEVPLRLSVAQDVPKCACVVRHAYVTGKDRHCPLLTVTIDFLQKLCSFMHSY